MPTDRSNEADYIRPVRRLVLGVAVVALLALVLVWRIDSPRIERFRAAFVDAVVPNMDWAMAPVTRVARMFEDFRSYARIYEQNQELRRELQQMRAWREAALQLEQRNAQLLDMVRVRLDPQLTHVTGVVMADAGSPYRQSVLINVGARDGIVDGWAVMDGLGLAGRIAGVGQRSSRVILLTDSNSRVPVLVQPSGQRALLSGDNSPRPVLDFVENPEALRPGDRVVSASDGGVFPPGLLVGEVVQDADGRLRVMLAADYGRLDFLRVLRSRPAERIEQSGTLLRPVDESGVPLDPATGLPLAPVDPAITAAPTPPPAASDANASEAPLPVPPEAAQGGANE
ncbi:MAG: rod shape-determining protein MreC [Pararhodobacter sp.]